MLFEEEYTEEAQILADLCTERAEAKANGKQIKPIYLDADANSLYPEPIKADIKIGRNDPCPCNSGKKYKKCCINT